MRDKGHDEHSVLMLAHFRQVYKGRTETGPQGTYNVPLTEEELQVEELHLAFSRNGLHWTALNGNRPVCPALAALGGVRDPFIARAPDGAFHLVATGGGGHRHMLHASSADLLHWDGPHSVPLMEHETAVRNVWAPEWILDAQTGEFFVFWSSSNGREGWDDSRIWCARTRDFLSFSVPRVLFDPGYTVIDAAIVEHDGTFTMFFKDERFGHVHGEHRHIKTATAPSLDGPYTVATDAVTPSITEGPAVFRAPNGSGWILLYDHCMDNRYGASVSDDLLHWRVAEDTAFPPNARHGSVFHITEAELARLLETHGTGA